MDQPIGRHPIATIKRSAPIERAKTPTGLGNYHGHRCQIPGTTDGVNHRLRFTTGDHGVAVRVSPRPHVRTAAVERNQLVSRRRVPVARADQCSIHRCPSTDGTPRLIHPAPLTEGRADSSPEYRQVNDADKRTLFIDDCDQRRVERNAPDEAECAVDGVYNPASSGRALDRAELLAQKRVGAVVVVNMVTNQLLGCPVGFGNLRSVRLFCDVEIAVPEVSQRHLAGTLGYRDRLFEEGLKRLSHVQSVPDGASAHRHVQ